MSISKRISLILFTSVVLLILAASLALFASFPRYSATHTLPGLQHAVEIIRDEQAVPHIHAENELDAYFALGFIHAQDRLWQMEFNLRAATGTLAEWFGSSMLPVDRFQRSLGLTEAVDRDLDQLDSETRAILSAYARGVNAYRSEIQVPPPEYLLLAVSPRTWEARDSLLLLKQMAWQLSRNYWNELLYVALGRYLSGQELNDFLSLSPDDPPLPSLRDIESLYPDLADFARTILSQAALKPSAGIGSNNWAITGSRTVSGKPLLANDPHLKLSVPALWYLAHISVPGMNAVGATLPGIPAIILGRNDSIAWSFTNTGADSQDLYLERSPADQPEYYETPKGKALYATRTETIRVRGAADEQITIRRSRHGPVISDSDEEIRSLMPIPHTLSLALNWVGLHPGDTTLQFFLKATRANSADDLLNASRDYQAPLQNIVYADNTGTIGFIAAGRTPIRSPENDLHGRIPAPGWLTRYDWQGFIAFELLPQEYAPSSEYAVTANQKITPPGYPYLVAADWALPYRAERITRLISNGTNHNVADSRAIQLDIKSTIAERLLPRLLQAQTQDPFEQKILDRLKQWDFNMHRDSPEPLIFVEWIQQLAALLYKDKFRELYDLIGDAHPESLIHVLNDPDAQTRWCADKAITPAPDPCNCLIESALRTAVARLSERYGTDPATWSWGHAHIATAHHPLLGKLPVLERLTSLISPRPGGWDTVNVSGYVYDEEDLVYKEKVVPGLRAIYDLANPENSIFSMGGGQSGHFMSPYYNNLTAGWAAGHYFPIHTSHDRIVSNAAGRLILNPSIKPTQSAEKN